MSARDREHVAEAIARHLLRGSFDASNVKKQGDRITFVWDDLAIQVIVADARPVRPEVAQGVCPFCGSTNLSTSRNDDDTFEPQRGCLDCNQWIDPVRFKRKS